MVVAVSSTATSRSAPRAAMAWQKAARERASCSLAASVFFGRSSRADGSPATFPTRSAARLRVPPTCSRVQLRWHRDGSALDLPRPLPRPTGSPLAGPDSCPVSVIGQRGAIGRTCSPRPPTPRRSGRPRSGDVRPRRLGRRVHEDPSNKLAYRKSTLRFTITQTALGGRYRLSWTDPTTIRFPAAFPDGSTTGRR
jgi:hypothetical protein